MINWPGVVIDKVHKTTVCCFGYCTMTLCCRGCKEPRVVAVNLSGRGLRGSFADEAGFFLDKVR